MNETETINADNTSANPNTPAVEAQPPVPAKKYRGYGSRKYRKNEGLSKRKRRKLYPEPKLRSVLPLLNAALRVWELKNGYN